MEPETLKGATEWYHHIELVGVFAVGVYVVGAIINILLQRWLGKGECKDCSTIKQNQQHLRDVTLPNMWGNISEMKGDLKAANAKLDLILKDQKLSREEGK